MYLIIRSKGSVIFGYNGRCSICLNSKTNNFLSKAIKKWEIKAFFSSFKACGKVPQLSMWIGTYDGIILYLLFGNLKSNPSPRF